MAMFLDDSTDEEIGVNLQLAERLSINRGENGYSKNRTFTEKDHKQLCNQKKKNIYREKSSSSSSLELQNEACCSGYTSAYGPHNKKRQNGDKNVEPLANPKRTCLSDRFVPPENKYSKPKSSNGDLNCLRKKDKCSSKPLNFMKQSLYPDNTYEDNVNQFTDDDSDFEPCRPFVHSKKVNNEDRLKKVKKQGNAKPEHSFPESHASSHNGIQLIDSASEEDSRAVIQNGALKGGRQSPEIGTFRKVLERKLKKVIESDDESEENYRQMGYRSRRFVFSSSDSDDSGPSSKVNKKPLDLALRKNANPSFSPLNSNHDHVYHKPDVPALGASYHENPSILPKQTNHRGRPTSKISRPHSSNRTLILPSELFENGAPSIPGSEGPSRHAGSSHLHRHHYSNSSKPSKGNPLDDDLYEYPLRNISPLLAPYNHFNPVPSNTFSLPNRIPQPNGESPYRTSGATLPKMTRHQRNRSSKSPKGRARSRLTSRYRDVSEDSSEVEFFTANSYSDAESNAEWLASLRTNNAPVQDLATNDLINVGSSEDEISVVFTSVSPSSRSSEQRRGSTRTLGRRYSRGSRRHILNPQDVVSLSPDPVEQVRQMEEDERFARMLQAQFDAEVDPPYVPRRRISPDPALMVMPELSSTSESDSVDLEVLPDTAPVFLGLINHFNFAPPSTPRAHNFRARRPETRFPTRTRRWEDPIPFSTSYLTRLVSGAFDSSDDSYEAFLNLAELNRDVPRGLHHGEINRLPTRKFVTLNGASSSGAELPHKRAELNKECQVCLSDYVNGDVLRILPCFHEFHTPCIDPWLKINHTCPVCRVSVDLGEYE